MEKKEPVKQTKARRKKCIYCEKLESANTAHRDRDGKWVCDDCWDPRLK